MLTKELEPILERIVKARNGWQAIIHYQLKLLFYPHNEDILVCGKIMPTIELAVKDAIKQGAIRGRTRGMTEEASKR